MNCGRSPSELARFRGGGLWLWPDPRAARVDATTELGGVESAEAPRGSEEACEAAEPACDAVVNQSLEAPVPDMGWSAS